MRFSFGGSEHEFVQVEVRGYERNSVGDYYDDNWLTSQIQVRAGGFRGNVDAAILTYELVVFFEQLQVLCHTLAGVAEFSTMEEQLHLQLNGDGKGQIELAGYVTDQPGIGNRLQFTLRFDQSVLQASVAELKQVVAQFPVRAA